MKIKKWINYILHSLDKNAPNRTYVGATNDFDKRIKAHNLSEKVGAKYTRVFRPYEPYCIITGFPTNKIALSHEWWLQHPNGRRRRAAKFATREGRINGLNLLLTESKRWKKKFGDLHLIIRIVPEMIEYLDTKKIRKNKNIKVFLMVN